MNATNRACHLIICTLAVGCALSFSAQSYAGDNRTAETVKVFVLAGQSNMEGKAKNSLFDFQANDPKTADFFAHLRHGDGWVTRDDVYIKFLDRHGKLTLGYGSRDRTGLEYEFGYRMGEHHKEPVLLIKAAWGGHSLYQDFRPPSRPATQERLEAKLKSEIEKYDRLNERKKAKTPKPTMESVKALYGASYRKMLAEVADVQKNLDTLFPELAGKKLEVAGFVWFQGWNDKYGGGTEEYAENMIAFIKDVRKDLNAPEMPFVIGVLGQGGVRELPPNKPIRLIQEAQLSMNEVPEFSGNVKAFRTDVLADQAALEAFKTWRTNPEAWRRSGSDEGYHYCGSAIWFTRIGRKACDALIQLKDTAGSSSLD